MAKTKRVRLERPEPAVMPETTPSQVVSMSWGTDYLSPSLPSGVSHDTYRALRTDPTVALARGVVSACLLSGSWSIEADEDVKDEVVEFITDTFMPLRERVLEAAVLGAHVDFGWQGFEQVFELDGGKIRITKLKPLLQDLTTILIDEATGAFRGFRQSRPTTGAYIDLLDTKALHIAFRVEGTDWYGKGLLENVRLIQAKWDSADSGAAKYDKRVAGAHFVVYYPPGRSIVNGAERDNGLVAKDLLTSLEASGSITVPTTIAKFVDEIASDNLAWRIEVLEDQGGRQPTFVDRLKYLDALKVRALLFPERAILEGEFGTKAEAGDHADIGIMVLQYVDRAIAEELNRQSVDPLLVMNYGEDMAGKVRIVPSPLIDEQVAFLRQLYTAMITNPQGFAEEFMTLDTDALKDRLNIPKIAQVAQAGTLRLPTPVAGITEEERLALSHFTPRTEEGKWTYDGSGLVPKFGPGFEHVDEAFSQARVLADSGKIQEARGLLCGIERFEDPQVNRAISRRVLQMMERFFHLEGRI